MSFVLSSLSLLLVDAGCDTQLILSNSLRHSPRMQQMANSKNDGPLLYRISPVEGPRDRPNSPHKKLILSRENKSPQVFFHFYFQIIFITKADKAGLLYNNSA